MVPAFCCKRPLKETRVPLLLCSKGSIQTSGSQSLLVFVASFNIAHCHLVPVLIILLLWLEPGSRCIFSVLLQYLSLLCDWHCCGADKSKD